MYLIPADRSNASFFNEFTRTLDSVILPVGDIEVPRSSLIFGFETKFC